MDAEPPRLPSRPPTAGTRRGRGAGYGGEANGPGFERPPIDELLARYIDRTPQQRAADKARREAQREILIDRLVDVAMRDDLAAANAAVSAVRIAGLMPAESRNLRIDRPETLTDDELAAIAAGSGEAAADPPEAAD